MLYVNTPGVVVSFGTDPARPPVSGPYPGRVNDRFLRALRREPVDRTPVWFMRQAGRYLPEYREAPGDRDILEAIREPEMAVEITLQPLRRMPLDAAIVFSDIVAPLAAIGVDVRIEPGVGPVVAEPIRDAEGLRRLRPLEPETDEPYALETIRLLRKELDVPLIGFAGAPFTLASYLVEGGPSRDHAKTKALMHGEPETWASLMDALAQISRAHLLAQAEAGAQAVQLFDSWVGALAPDDYRRSVLPWVRRVLDDLAGPARSTSGSAPGNCWNACARPAATPSASTGAFRSTSRGSASATTGRSKATSIPPPAWLHGRSSSARPSPCSSAPRSWTGTCSTSDTACLPQTPVEHLHRLVDLVHERTERPRT